MCIMSVCSNSTSPSISVVSSTVAVTAKAVLSFRSRAAKTPPAISIPTAPDT